MIGDDIYKVSPEMEEEIDALSMMDDSKIDLTDPELPSVADWPDAARGKFYRPVKKVVTIRLDSDIISWFKAQGGKYQTKINKVLREYITQQFQPPTANIRDRK